jgi:hypothetical protein
MHWFVLAAAVVATGFGFFFAVAALSLPPGNAAVPVSIAFFVLAMLGGTVAGAIQRLDHRLSRIEQQLTDRSRTSS